jgi:hypothetical protein
MAWDEHVQFLWMQPCLTTDLLLEFNEFWHRYTASSDDRRSTALREISHRDAVRAIDELVALSARTAVAASRKPAQERLATLADLS